MNSVTRKQIIERFSELTDTNLKDAEYYIDAVATIISDALIKNEKIHLKYVGTFQRKKAKEKQIYNFVTKKIETVPEHGKVVFTPCQSLREDVY